jgi:hypothetical protein
MALRAKFKFETDVFFMILLRKIMKNTSVSKEYSAVVGGKNLFTQPLRFAPNYVLIDTSFSRFRFAKS